MDQALLFGGIFVFGAVFAFAFGPRRDPVLCAALAVPVGIATSVLLALALCVIGLPVTQLSMGVITGLALGGAGFAAARRGAIDRRAQVVIAIWGVAVLFVAYWAATYFEPMPKCPRRVPLCILNGRLHAHEEHVLDVMSGNGEERNLVLDMMWHRLPNTDFFLLVFRTLCRLVGVDRVPALYPVLAVSMGALLAVVTWRLWSRTTAPVWVRALVVVAIAAILTKDLHFAYRNYFLARHLDGAIFVFGFAGLWMLAEVERDAAPVPMALVCLAAFALQSPASFVPAALMLAIATCASRIPRAQLASPLAVFTAGALLWLSYPGSEDKFPEDDQLAMAAFGAAFGLWTVLGARSVRRLAPFVAAAMGIAGIAWFGLEWSRSPQLTRQLLMVYLVPIALAALALALSRLVARRAVPVAGTATEAEGPLAMFGGRQRVTLLLFTAVIGWLVVSNTRLYFRNQRKSSVRFQLFAHDLFVFQEAARGVPEPEDE